METIFTDERFRMQVRQSHSFSALQADPTQLLHELKQTHAPITLTVNGTPEAVIQDIAGYQRLLDIAARADEAEGIRQGEEDYRNGRSQPAEEALEEIRIASGIQG